MSRENFRLLMRAFDCVYSSLCWKHYTRRTKPLLKVKHRILKPGESFASPFRIWPQVLNKYVPEAPEVFLDELFESKQKSLKNMHHWHYNEFSLRRTLEAVGFQNIFQGKLPTGACLDLDLIEQREESLFMEAVR